MIPGEWGASLILLTFRHNGIAEMVKVYQKVDDIFRKKPHLLPNSGVEIFYQCVINVLLTELENSNSEIDRLFPVNQGDSERTKRDRNDIDPSKVDISFARSVVERAITVCPEDSILWNMYEKLETIAGQHQQVSHIKWKRAKIANI